MPHKMPHPKAGQTVQLRSGEDFRIKDWNDRVLGRSWTVDEGNPVAIVYEVRAALTGLPLDDEVVYGEDDAGTAHLIHVSELS